MVQILLAIRGISEGLGGWENGITQRIKRHIDGDKRTFFNLALKSWQGAHRMDPKKIPTTLSLRA